MTNTIKERSKYWKEKRDNYIQKVKEEYKVKELRGMTEEKTFKCPLCTVNHKIDKYNFVDSCIGYFDRNNIEYEIVKYLEKMKKDGEKESKINTKTKRSNAM